MMKKDYYRDPKPDETAFSEIQGIFKKVSMDTRPLDDLTAI